MNTESKLDPNSLPNALAERVALAARLKEVALAARARGELLTAMLHASDALMLFPNEPQYLDLVDGVAQSSPDPLSLVPVAAGAVHVATGAVRARILMAQNRPEEALDLLGDIAQVAPSLAYLPWALRWLEPQLIQHLGTQKLMSLVLRQAIRLTLDLPAPAHPDDPRLPNVAATAEMLAAVRQQFPDEVQLYWGEVIARRRLGDLQAALAVAGAGVQRFPNEARLHCSLLMAYHDAKRPDEALHHARIALQLDPEDRAPLYDAAWAFVEAQRFPDALNVLSELQRLEPDYPGADVAVHYLQYRVHGSPQDKDALLKLRERRWWDGRARKLADEVEPVEQYFNYLPGPADATAVGARSLLRELGPVFRCCGAGARIGYTLQSTYLESPSVGLGLDVAVRALGGGGAAMRVEADAVQTPDPRIPKTAMDYRLWQYEGTQASRVYPAADPGVQQSIAQIANVVFGQAQWEPAARQLAQRCSPEWVHAYLAVMTDPPLPPEGSGFDGLMWTYRCQIASALVLSYLGPWEPSVPGRTAVYSLIYGASDWTTAAGLIALAWRARSAPELRNEALQVFQWMKHQIPEKGFTPWELPLICLWQGLGPHSPETTAELAAWHDQYEATRRFKGEARVPERRYGGLTLAQYAEFTFERDRILTVAGGGRSSTTQAPVPELVELCQRFGVPLDSDVQRACPYITEWQEAISANRRLSETFMELSRNIQLTKLGVSGEEIAALDQIRDSNMDMHLRMAQQQDAQRAMNEGHGGDPDPVVFPGQPVEKLSDYVGILKGMQSGDMMGALAAYGIDMMSYGAIAGAWGAKLAADPVLNEKFSRMMS